MFCLPEHCSDLPTQASCSCSRPLVAVQLNKRTHCGKHAGLAPNSIWYLAVASTMPWIVQIYLIQ